MPKLHFAPFPTELHAISLIDSAGQSIRTVARTVGVPKSTLHDNLGKYRVDLASFETWRQSSERRLVGDILSQTFEGKASSRDCAAVISRSTGHEVSHQKVLLVLQQAAKVASEKNNERLKLKLLTGADDVEAEPLSLVKCAAFDEIFQKQRPVLGFVDPVSSFVYLDAPADRSERSWADFLNKLKSLGLNPDSTVTDGGQGMLKALKKVFPNALQFRDLFHVRYKLSKALRALEGICYGLIAAHDKALKSSVGEDENTVAKLKMRMEKAILIFDALEHEVKLLGQACYFENQKGHISSKQVGIIADRIVALIDCGERNGIKHRAVRAAKTYLAGARNNIVAYKAYIEQIVTSQFGVINAHAVLDSICPIIEFLDQIQRSYENDKQRAYWTNKLVEARARFRQFHFIDQTEVDRAIDATAKIMGRAKKSNSLIEAINSVIRRHLVTYKSIPSWFCPLFTFYWNHRQFKRGKRRNLRPREILTGKPFEQDWIEVLLDAFPFEATSQSTSCSAQGGTEAA